MSAALPFVLLVVVEAALQSSPERTESTSSTKVKGEAVHLLLLTTIAAGCCPCWPAPLDVDVELDVNRLFIRGDALVLHELPPDADQLPEDDRSLASFIAAQPLNFTWRPFPSVPKSFSSLHCPPPPDAAVGPGDEINS